MAGLVTQAHFGLSLDPALNHYRGGQGSLTPEVPVRSALAYLFKMLPFKEAGQNQPSRYQHDIAMEVIQHEILAALRNFSLSSKNS